MSNCIIRLLILLNLLSLGILSSSLAQVQLPSEEVQVVRDFDARLGSAERLLMNPQLPPFDTTQLSYNFRIQDRQLDYDYQPPEIRALGMGRTELEKSYSTYLRAGYGTPKSPLADGYTSFRGSNYQAYAEGSHYSVDNRNNLENQIIGRTHLGLGGEYIFGPSFYIDGHLKYDHLINDLYGYDHEVDSFSREDAARRFNLFHADFSLGSKESNSWGLQYKLKTAYENTSDNLLASENQFQLLAQVAWEISDQQAIEVEGKARFINFTDSISADPIGLNIFTFKPSYSYQTEKFSARVGLFVGNANETSLIFPEIHAQYSVLEDQLIAYLGSAGSLQAQGFSQLSQRNPYFTNTMDSLYATRQWEIFAGAKGRYNQLKYNLEVAYQNFSNLAFFTPDFKDTRLFDAYYESGSAIDISLNLNYPVTENLTTSLTLNQTFFSLDSLESPIHTPTFTADFRTEYSLLSQKLNFWFDIRFQNGVDYLDSDNQIDQLEGLFDLSLGADYFFAEHWGVFFHAYNLTNNTRQRWNQYPIIGRNILGGIIMRF